MKYFPSFLLLMVLVDTAHAADLSCPAGYMRFETDAIIISMDNTCPAGTMLIGPANACDDGAGFCYMFGCPDGTLLYNGGCVAVCASGFAALKTSTGLSFTAWAKPNTSPTIVIQNGERAPCYVNLAPGGANKAININYDGNTYHTVD